jgi:hypothetical protein
VSVEQHTLTQTVPTPGAAWRAAAWVILAVDVLIVVLLHQLQGQKGSTFDIVAAAVFVAAFLTLIGLTIVGVGAGAVGAKQASDAGDRRFVVILPVLLHVVLLMAAFASLAAR